LNDFIESQFCGLASIATRASLMRDHIAHIINVGFPLQMARVYAR
jgi:hypothetical protein